TFEGDRTVIVDGLCSVVGAGTTEPLVFRSGASVESSFLAYSLRTDSFLKLGHAAMYGVAGQQRVPDEFVMDWPIRTPPLDEQRRIADFLDEETRRIDRLVLIRERQIALIEEKIFSGLSETLVPGSCSGPEGKLPFPWLPSIPQDRPLVKLGHICRLQNGITIDNKRKLAGDVVTLPYLRVANVQAGHVDLDTVVEVTVPRETAARSTLRRGDVLMTEGGDLDKLGRGAVWHDEIPGCLHQNHIFALRPDQGLLDGEYLSLMTRTAHGRCYFESTGSRTTNLASTNSSKILDFRIPLPSLGRQRELASESHGMISGITRMADALQRQIELLGERKRALITAAVTGEFDVSTASGRGTV
ncbi:MAG: type restriction enzyme subunit, partial [Actinomycetota bacterium]|nr:type restriction enzyme subunit [Actinomycetota bacterium]